MAIVLPDLAREVIERIRSDVNSSLVDSNPWLKSSFLKAIVDGVGNRIFDEGYLQFKALIRMLRPDTAEDEFLDFWAFVKNITTIAAQPATGLVTATGTIGQTVSAGSVLAIGTIEYTVDSSVNISANVKSISSLTANGGVAVCITNDDHNFATGKNVTISGVNESGYNGDHVITVNDAKSFTFVVDQGVTSPTTGTRTATMNMASIAVTADLTSVNDTGLDTNQDNGTELTFQSSVAGIDDIAVVQWDGLVGGRNQETESEKQERVVDRWRNPITSFNANNIERVAKTIDGVTRVWVYQPGMGDVVPGEVKIYFVRDNDESIIPDAGEISDVRTEILAIKEAHVYDDDVIVPGMTGIPVDVTVSNVVPSTPTMIVAVQNTIRSFFRGGISESEQLTPDKLKSAIQQTYDPSLGEKIVSYSLLQPTSNVDALQGEIVVEGTTNVGG